jgi:quercetin dioxygenase-like cupin family protein
MTNPPQNSPLPSGVHLALPGSGIVIAVVGDVYRFLATGDQTDGRYALWEAIVPPGGGPPPHRHSRESESFWILAGELEFRVDERRIVAGPGTFVHLEPGTKHSFRNESAKTARMLIQVVPAGLERMFLEVGVRLNSPDDPVPPIDPQEPARLLAAAERYGVTIFPPKRPADKS